MSSSVHTSERTFALLVTIAFAIVAGIVTAYHEPWRDEMQAWLIARDSGSIAALLAHLKYEGHPALWYLALYGLQRLLGSDPTVMQVFHVLVAAAAVGVVARFAPFSRAHRAAFAAGYFPLYEYGVLARNYSLCVLLVAIACTLFVRRRLLTLAVAIGLLAHTIVYGTLLALALAAAMLVERLRPGPGARVHRATDFRLAGAFGIILLGGLTAAAQLRPPPDSGFAPEWHTTVEGDRVRATVLTMRSALVPVHAIRVRYFDSLITDRRPRLALAADAFALLAVLLVLRALLPVPLALAFYLVGTTTLLGFTYVKYAGYLRHHGFLFIATVAALWLALGDADRQSDQPSAAPVRPPDRLTGWLLTGMLGMQVLAAGVACWLELRHVFSYGRAAAEYLESGVLGDRLLAADPDGNAAAVLGFLPSRPTYFPRGDRFGTFAVWDTARLIRPDDHELIARVRATARRRQRDAILLVGGRLPDSVVTAEGLTLLIAYPDAAVSGESFALYLVSTPRNPLGRP